MILPRGFALSAFVCLTYATATAASLRVETSTAWVENISRSSGATDWRDALRHELGVSGGLFRQWTRGLTTQAEVGASYERVPRFTELDVFAAGFSGQARQKFGLGAMAPVLSFDASLRRREAQRDGDDGWTAASALRFGKRVTESWRLSATGDWQQHSARSAIFDTRHHRAFGTVTWDITPRWQLSHGNGRLWGDFTANASATVWARALSGAFGPDISSYYNSVPWGATNTFGPGWVTYRITGRVSFWWLELSPALGPNTSLPLRYDSTFSVSKVGVKYRQDIWTVQLLHRF
jgi:hypothetical protein